METGQLAHSALHSQWRLANLHTVPYTANGDWPTCTQCPTQPMETGQLAHSALHSQWRLANLHTVPYTANGDWPTCTQCPTQPMETGQLEKKWPFISISTLPTGVTSKCHCNNLRLIQDRPTAFWCVIPLTKTLKTPYSGTQCGHRNLSTTPHYEQFDNVLSLLDLVLMTLLAPSTNCDRDISHMNKVKSDWCSKLCRHHGEQLPYNHLGNSQSGEFWSSTCIGPVAGKLHQGTRGSAPWMRQRLNQIISKILIMIAAVKQALVVKKMRSFPGTRRDLPSWTPVMLEQSFLYLNKHDLNAYSWLHGLSLSPDYLTASS